MKNFLLYLLLSASLIDNIYSAPTKKKNKKTSQRKKSGKKSKSGKSGRSGSGSIGTVAAVAAGAAAGAAAGVAAEKALEESSIGDIETNLLGSLTYDPTHLDGVAKKITDDKEQKKAAREEAIEWGKANNNIIDKSIVMIKVISRRFINVIDRASTLTENQKKAMKKRINDEWGEATKTLQEIRQKTDSFLKKHESWYKEIKKYEYMLYIEAETAQLKKKEYIDAIERDEQLKNAAAAFNTIATKEFYAMTKTKIQMKKNAFIKSLEILKKRDDIRLFNQEIKQIDKKIKNNIDHEVTFSYLTERASKIGTYIVQQDKIKQQEIIDKLHKARETLIMQSEKDIIALLKSIYNCITSEAAYQLTQQASIHILKAKKFAEVIKAKGDKQNKKSVQQLVEEDKQKTAIANFFSTLTELCNTEGKGERQDKKDLGYINRKNHLSYVINHKTKDVAGSQIFKEIEIATEYQKLFEYIIMKLLDNKTQKLNLIKTLPTLDDLKKRIQEVEQIKKFTENTLYKNHLRETITYIQKEVEATDEQIKILDASKEMDERAKLIAKAKLRPTALAKIKKHVQEAQTKIRKDMAKVKLTEAIGEKETIEDISKMFDIKDDKKVVKEGLS